MRTLTNTANTVDDQTKTKYVSNPVWFFNVFIGVVDLNEFFVEYRLGANEELTVLWVGSKHNSGSTVPLDTDLTA